MTVPTGTKNIEDYVPVVKYNGGLYTSLPMYVAGDFTVTGTTTIGGISLTNLTVTGNTLIGDADTDTLGVQGLTTFTNATATTATVIGLTAAGLTSGHALVITTAGLTTGSAIKISAASMTTGSAIDTTAIAATKQNFNMNASTGSTAAPQTNAPVGFFKIGIGGTDQWVPYYGSS